MSKDAATPTRLPTVALVGNFGVGKSTMFKRLSLPAEPARGQACLRLPDGTKVKLVDTCGMERFDNTSLTGSYYRDAACVLLVADATNMRSAQSLQNWKDSAAFYAPKAKMILVINKIDSPDADRILLSSIESYRAQLDCCFSVLMSAKTVLIRRRDYIFWRQYFDGIEPFQCQESMADMGPATNNPESAQTVNPTDTAADVGISRKDMKGWASIV